ncbi:DUF2264 domain-containing protein [Algibacter amylolyticus]|uniref:DUF2264 domain-containing protein n=1 Tax=Algibacter amylolyticus TaxID=1608400 RepID=A0A5M7B278_9FLAO|nr:DUF2264 domain-containing protein [Algibacter amylolyticus]KAA5823686.1 DUF2264 domain-containing protein [Algibacter amylolyticus]MBB5267855.1 hypothetical protein [Algibacter amylolyticus]TSJ74174.1 DUF2264 domain-containing protein [Algibacter amylolyticus]
MSYKIKYAFLIFTISVVSFNTSYAQKESPEEVREFLVSSLIKIGDPVLTALSKNELKVKMPVEKSPGAWDDRKHVTYLEAFGRLLSGMAPWLELGPDTTKEGKLRAKYIKMAQVCVANATNPESPDFMNFNNDKQPLVDAAFLAQALIRAPKQLWEPLDEKTKENVLTAFKSTRVIKPYYSNWLLFSGMIEAALLKFDAGADMMRLDYPLNKHKEWYLGDGMYGDGPDFHWDYYNSFVIQPMILDILNVVIEKDKHYKRDFDTALNRAKRYAAIQERLISPDGTYPPIGRSLAYRFGAFQLLSQVALWNQLPKNVAPAQVRSAFYTMIHNQINAPGTFDKKGWLQIGLYGHQPNIGEGYISTGSLYLCSEAFLVLGLPANDVFWTDAYKPWTQKKIWSGENIPIDHAIKN